MTFESPGSGNTQIAGLHFFTPAPFSPTARKSEEYTGEDFNSQLHLQFVIGVNGPPPQERTNSHTSTSINFPVIEGYVVARRVVQRAVAFAGTGGLLSLHQLAG